MYEWIEKGFREAVGSTLVWASVIIATLIAGFCAGYWIGHQGITSADKTFNAFLWLPFLWLGLPQVILGYVVTLVAWFLPLRYDSGRLRLGAAGANLVVWLVLVVWIVERTRDAKWFHF